MRLVHFPDTFIGIVLLAVLFLSGCYPSYHLQSYRASILSDANTISIEQGNEKRHYEFGISYNSTFGEEELPLTDETYYDYATRREETTTANCFYSFPAYSINLYGAMLGERLVSAFMECRFGQLDTTWLTDLTVGVGVRLYQKHLGGRIFILGGISKISSDVLIFEDNAEDFEDIDYMDTYSEYRLSIGATATVNTLNENWPINGFLNFYTRYRSFFSWKDSHLDLFTFSATAGIWKSIGPLLLSTGFKLKTYGAITVDHTENFGSYLLPELVTQITLSVPPRAKKPVP